MNHCVIWSILTNKNRRSHVRYINILKISKFYMFLVSQFRRDLDTKRPPLNNEICPLSGDIIKKFTSLFPSDFKACLFDKILSPEFYLKAVFFECKLRISRSAIVLDQNIGLQSVRGIKWPFRAFASSAFIFCEHEQWSIFSMGAASTFEITNGELRALCKFSVVFELSNLADTFQTGQQAQS